MEEILHQLVYMIYIDLSHSNHSNPMIYRVS